MVGNVNLCLKSVQKPRGYWKDFSNLKEEIKVVIEELGHFPTRLELRRLGRSDIDNAVSRYHEGLFKVKEEMGFKPDQKPRGYWRSWQNLMRELLPIVEKLGYFPSSPELARMKRWDILNSMRDYHGGHQAVREKLGYSRVMKPKISVEDIRKFKDLYASGCSVEEISDKTGRNRLTVIRHLRKLGMARSRSEALQLAYGRKRRWSKQILEAAKELSVEKAYILGVVGPGDGHIREKGVKLSVVDKDFALKFKSCLEKVYNLACTVRVANKEGRRRPQTVVYLFSVAVVRDILRYGDSILDFRHGGERVPAAIKTACPEIQASYIQAIADSQGSVKFYEVSLHKKNLKVLEEIGELLKNFGIKYRIEGYKSERLRIAIRGRELLHRFSEKIGFSIKRKQEKLDEALTRLAANAKRSLDAKRCSETNFSLVSTQGT